MSHSRYHDAPAINTCLANARRAVLGSGVFRLSRPIELPGFGSAAPCGQASPYLQELRRDCGHKGAYAIMVDKSEDVQVLTRPRPAAVLAAHLARLGGPDRAFETRRALRTLGAVPDY